MILGGKVSTIEVVFEDIRKSVDKILAGLLIQPITRLQHHLPSILTKLFSQIPNVPSETENGVSENASQSKHHKRGAIG